MGANGRGNGKKGKLGHVAKDKPKKPAGKPTKPARKTDLIGARVRVECSDGQFYQGRVHSWDTNGSKEYKIILDDGASTPLAPLRVQFLLLASLSLPADSDTLPFP
jgi:hypothetical protein